jgi:hypothetical protein
MNDAAVMSDDQPHLFHLAAAPPNRSPSVYLDSHCQFIRISLSNRLVLFAEIRC